MNRARRRRAAPPDVQKGHPFERPQHLSTAKTVNSSRVARDYLALLRAPRQRPTNRPVAARPKSRTIGGAGTSVLPPEVEPALPPVDVELTPPELPPVDVELTPPVLPPVEVDLQHLVGVPAGIGLIALTVEPSESAAATARIEYARIKHLPHDRWGGL
jgi:hypothetical protein